MLPGHEIAINRGSGSDLGSGVVVTHYYGALLPKDRRRSIDDDIIPS